MSETEPDFGLEVLTDGNVILRERLTRTLRDGLNEIDGVDVRFAPADEQDTAGAKSAELLGEAALWVYLGRQTTKIVIEAIKASPARQKARAIRITRGKDSIEIPRHPDAAQEQLAERFLAGGDQ